MQKLSLSNQLGSLVHTLGANLVPAVEGGQLPVVEDPILLLATKVADLCGRVVCVSSVQNSPLY